jgi:hypothetical protein
MEGLESRLVKQKSRIQKILFNRITDPEIYSIVVGRPNTAKAIKERITVVEKTIRGAL